MLPNNISNPPFSLDPFPPKINIEETQSIIDLENTIEKNTNNYIDIINSQNFTKLNFSNINLINAEKKLEIKKNHESDLTASELPLLSFTLDKKKSTYSINTKKHKKTSETLIKAKSKTDKKNKISNSVNLIGVIKLIKEFHNNLKYSIFYKKYENLKENHFKIINDYSIGDDFYQKTVSFDLLKTKSTVSSKMARYFSIRLLFLFIMILSFFKKIIFKCSKLYNKYISIINPDNKLIFYWNFINILYISSFFVIIPLHISFSFLMSKEMRSMIFMFKKISFLIFAIDIFIRLHLGFYDETGEKVMIRKLIWLKYFRKYFIYDIIFSLIFFFENETNPNFKFFALLIFVKYFHFKKLIQSIEEKLSLSDFSEGIFLLIKLVLKIAFIAHIIACFYHIVGVLSTEYYLKSWFIFLDPLKIDEWEYRYIYSIYWSVTTVITVGYGDITPQNQYEVIFSIFIILIGCGTFAYGINSVGSILISMRAKEENYSKELRILNRFMNKNNLNYDLQSRVRKYFQFVRREEDDDQIEKENSIISKLTLGLQNEIILNTNGYILKNMKFFSNNFSEDFLQKLVSKLKKRRYLPEEYIINENKLELDNGFYYIQKGQIELSVNCIREGKVTKLCTLEKGECFNEISFVLDRPSNYCAKSVNYTTIFYINKKEFTSLLKEYNYDFEKFCMIRDKIIFNNDFEDLKLSCKLCNKNNHYINYCPSLIGVKDVWKTIKLYQNSDKYIEIKRQPKKRRKKCKLFSNCRINKKEFVQKAKNFNKKSYSFNYNLETDSIINQISCDNLTFNSKKDLINNSSPNDDKNLERGNSNLNSNFSFFQNNDEINHIFLSKEEFKENTSENCSKFINDNNSESDHKSFGSKINDFKSNNLFNFNFDNYKNFEYYFPINNFVKVLKKIKTNFFLANNKKLMLASTGSVKKENNNLQKLNSNRRSFFKEENITKSISYSPRHLKSNK